MDDFLMVKTECDKNKKYLYIWVSAVFELLMFLFIYFNVMFFAFFVSVD